MDLSAEMAELWESLGAPPAGRPLAIEFVAARDGEGVSTVARELAFHLARWERRRVWLIDLDLIGQSQAQAFADDPLRFGEIGQAAQASPDGPMVFTVRPALARHPLRRRPFGGRRGALGDALPARGAEAAPGRARDADACLLDRPEEARRRGGGRRAGCRPLAGWPD